ncbi:MAG TPA: sensor histidine kinase [Puia sp.]|nr:sensor histidine kinase [Puia sp.]
MFTHPRFRYYLLFTACFTVFWFLFKFGGIINLRLALLSTALDTLLNLSILLATVEGLMPAYFYKGRYGRFAALLGLIILLGGSIDILGQLSLQHMSLFTYQTQLSKYKEHFFYWFWSDLVAGSYFMLIVVALGGLATRLAFDRIRSELEALKSQTNPHFILNALNTIYYSIESGNQPARELTERFASLLRYQLYECDTPTVPIEKELQCINDYIGLQRQRTADTVTIDCTGLHHLSGFSIPPHLLIPLVENCFKHVSHFPDKLNFIELSATRENGAFTFRTRNSFDPARSLNGSDPARISVDPTHSPNGPDRHRANYSLDPARSADGPDPRRANDNLDAARSPNGPDPTRRNGHPGIGLALTRKRLSLLASPATLEAGPDSEIFLTTLTLRLP